MNMNIQKKSKNSWASTSAKATLYDEEQQRKITAGAAQEETPQRCVVVFIKSVMILLGIYCGYEVFSVQMAKPMMVVNSNLLLFATLMYIAHWCYPTIVRNKSVTTPTPASFSYFVGPYAAALATGFFYSSLVLNILWAYRWLLGVENVCKNVYGLNDAIIKNLTECGNTHPYVEPRKTCHVLGSFLNRPVSLYIHCFGAVTSLALGPFQFWGWFRKNYIQVHRVMGYLYIVCCVTGAVGAGMLITQTTSGILVAIGFTVLEVAWIGYLIVALYHIKNGRINLHKEWMMRQYSLTFSAIPFRFLPAFLQGFGFDAENAYWMGAYLTIICGLVFGEVFVRYLRRTGYGNNMEKLDEGAS